METFQSKEGFEGCAYRDYPKAVKVSASDSGVGPPSAFLAVPRLRHVVVEEGIHTVGALAWQNCRQLRIVKLPATVVRIEESAFRGCHWLNSIAAPGCTGFGYKAFADCCSLQYVHANGGVNTFKGMTKLGPYLFDACINIATIRILPAVLEPCASAPNLCREIPQGCFCSTGLSDLRLPPGFHRLGAHAFDNCKILALVDISDTTILEIREFTFANCVLLQRIIHAKAFVNCAALQELAIPPSLHYIACKAFLDCTVLRGLTQMPGQRMFGTRSPLSTQWDKQRAVPRCGMHLVLHSTLSSGMVITVS